MCTYIHVFVVDTGATFIHVMYVLPVHVYESYVYHKYMYGGEQQSNAHPCGKKETTVIFPSGSFLVKADFEINNQSNYI